LNRRVKEDIKSTIEKIAPGIQLSQRGSMLKQLKIGQQRTNCTSKPINQSNTQVEQQKSAQKKKHSSMTIAAQHNRGDI
jgi:hypothetical protein